MIEGLEKLLEGCGEAGLPELRALLQELLGGKAAEGSFVGQSELKPHSTTVLRLRFVVNGHPETLIVKRLSPPIARRIELAAKRWLPMAGLSEVGPSLAGSAAAHNGTYVWHVYQDLGPHELDPLHAPPEAVRAAVEQIARMHTRFAKHPLLGEIRLHGGDLGMPFLRANVRDALYALEAWHTGPNEEPLRERLLHRLDTLRGEFTVRGQVEEEWGQPETLLHGDLWAMNVFVMKTEDGLRARLIDWDHVAVGPFSYDLSTFLLRFPPERRPFILDVYREELGRSGWQLPTNDTLNALFETAEYARIVNRIVWPAIALAVDHADWAMESLAEVERWFGQFRPVLPPHPPSSRAPPRAG